MTNNNEKTTQELEAELQWEESTAHRNKHKNSFNYKAIAVGIKAINLAISG